LFLLNNKTKNKMKTINILFGLIFITTSLMAQTSFYDFKVKDIDGNDFSFSKLRGKKVLLVNTASKCGNTPQYADLEKFYVENKDNNFVIIGFPANNFGSQEPGTNEEIKSFCQKNYGVTFPMMSKISVKGEDMHILYKWLTTKDLNGYKDSQVRWNFQKYLVNEEGKLIDILDPKTSVNTLKL
jgi:glutathione peroxidase